jgi:hypothetical protein
MCAHVETGCQSILGHTVVGSLKHQPQIAVPTKGERGAAVLSLDFMVS